MKKHFKELVASICVLAAFFGCTKNNDVQQPNASAIASSVKNLATAQVSNSALIAYKNSQHHLFVGYLVDDGADPTASTNPANSPDSVDFLEFFSGRDANRADWRVAQAKGTRIVVCHFLSDGYYDGSTSDPLSSGTYTGSASKRTYKHWASAMYQQHILSDSLDGIDIDVESGTFGGGVQSGANLDSLSVALSHYFGPQSTAGLTAMGKKPVFFFDTDGSADGNAYSSYRNNYDYVLFQSYTSGSHSWGGGGTQGFPPLVSTYGLNKLIFLVNGDSFTSSMSDPATTSLLSYAQWVVQNNGIGVGAYRMSRDYNHTPPFAASRDAIQIMNP